MHFPHLPKRAWQVITVVSVIATWGSWGWVIAHAAHHQLSTATRIGVITLIFVAIGYGLALMAVAKYQVDGSPRRDMYICDKHGPMPLSVTFVIFEDIEYIRDGRTQRGPLRVCPICFEGAVTRAKDIFKKKD